MAACKTGHGFIPHRWWFTLCLCHFTHRCLVTQLLTLDQKSTAITTSAPSSRVLYFYSGKTCWPSCGKTSQLQDSHHCDGLFRNLHGLVMFPNYTDKYVVEFQIQRSKFLLILSYRPYNEGFWLGHNPGNLAHRIV